MISNSKVLELPSQLRTYLLLYELEACGEVCVICSFAQKPTPFLPFLSWFTQCKAKYVHACSYLRKSVYNCLKVAWEGEARAPPGGLPRSQSKL